MEKDDNDLLFTVDPNGLNTLARGAVRLFEKPIDNLNYREATLLLGGFVMAMSQGESTVVSPEGDVIADSKMDGEDTLKNIGMNEARKLASQINDEQELIINVVRNKTLWEKIRKRKPKVIQTLRYKNEPERYA